MTELECVDFIIQYGYHFIGKPYIWGGRGPQGLDCSGLIVELFRSIGIIRADFSAEQLFRLVSVSGKMQAKPFPGALVFYGSSDKEITHVALGLNGSLILEAGGGAHTTLTANDAESLGAMVRVRPYTYRKDLITIVMPSYETLLSSS